MRLSLLLVVVFSISCSSGKEETITPLVQNITESVYASGKVKSKDQYEVYASAAGIIQQVHVKEGDAVRKGDALLTLVNDVQQLSEENARLSATYSSVQANLDKIAESEAAIALAKTKMLNDSMLLSRQQSLWANDIGTRNDLEQRELALKNSTTAWQTAILRDQALKRQLQFAAEQSKKALQISRTMAGDYTIWAKQDGRIYSIAKEEGELVSLQTPIAVIGNSAQFLLELQVDEYDISKIHPGQQLAITLDSYRGQAFEGTVTKIIPLMNEHSRSFTIEAEFTKQPPQLYPNVTAEANILIRTKEKAVTIPRTYLLDDSTVILKNGDTRHVVVGLKDYQRVEIISGLTSEESIRKPGP